MIHVTIECSGRPATSARTIERGLIDEWHVWEIEGNADEPRGCGAISCDGATPNNSLEYYRSARQLELQGPQANLRFSVRATNDCTWGCGASRVRGRTMKSSWAAGTRGPARSASWTTSALSDVASRDRHRRRSSSAARPGCCRSSAFSDVETRDRRAGARCAGCGRGCAAGSAASRSRRV